MQYNAMCDREGTPRQGKGEITKAKTFLEGVGEDPIGERIGSLKTQVGRGNTSPIAATQSRGERWWAQPKQAAWRSILRRGEKVACPNAQCPGRHLRRVELCDENFVQLKKTAARREAAV